jgi:hypothetical protein
MDGQKGGLCCPSLSSIMYYDHHSERVAFETGGQKRTGDYFSKFSDSPLMTIYNYTTKLRGKQ